MKPHPVYLKAAKGEWLSVTDVAKLIRSNLAKHFPGVTFSVRSKSYSGGSSINVSWANGPTTEQVNPFVMCYKTKSFDGMIDMASYRDLWLYPDGSAHVAHDSGTEGSMGTHPEIIESAKRPDAVLVTSIDGSYIFTDRTVGTKAVRFAMDQIRSERWESLAMVDWESVEIKGDEESAWVDNCGQYRFHGATGWLDGEINRRARAIAYPEALPDTQSPEPVAVDPFAAHAPVLCW